MSELSRACRPVAGASGQCQRLAVRLLAAASPPMPEPYPSRSGLVLDGGDLPELIPELIPELRPELIPERGLGEPVCGALGGSGCGSSRSARGGAFAAYVWRAHRAKGRADVAAGLAATVGCRRVRGGGGGHGRGGVGAARVFLPDDAPMKTCGKGMWTVAAWGDEDDDDDEDAMLLVMMATG